MSIFVEAGLPAIAEEFQRSRASLQVLLQIHFAERVFRSTDWLVRVWAGIAKTFSATDAAICNV